MDQTTIRSQNANKIVMQQEIDEDTSNDTITKKEKRMNRLSQRRFGHTVQFEKYKTSNPIKIVCVTLAICIIPLEIFVQHVLQDAEGNLIEII